ncbi:MAG TPA: PAS domain-containing protein [Terriglobales bacterium]|nr:PAS domain-containing protein [Terriglobales bacterium]
MTAIQANLMPIIRQFDFDRATIRSPHLQALYDYWSNLRGDRVAPDVDEVDAMAIPRAALPYVILVDLEQNPLRARYRLVGTHSVQAAGWDYTGKYVDEIDMPNTMAGEIMEDFAFAIAKRPMYANYEWPLRDDRGIVNVELLQLPLLQDGIVTRCFCGEHVGQDLDLFSDDMMPIEKA